MGGISQRSFRDNVPRSIAELAPYKTHNVDCPVKLHANESPHELPQALAIELAETLATVKLNRYPDPTCARLRQIIARRHGVDPQTIVFGNGSDELIAMIIGTFSGDRRGRPARIIYPGPTFSVYSLAARALQCEPVEFATNHRFELDEDEFVATIDELRPNVCFMALPNNPTGTLWSPKLVVRLAKMFPEMIVVSDEAYADYSGVSNMGHTGQLPNLIVMRTLSKIGMAALRVGYAICPPEVAALLEAVRPPYNIGGINQAAAVFAMTQAQPWIEQATASVAEQRERVAVALAGIDGVTVYPSAANLVMIRLAGRSGTSVWRGLADAGVLVRKFSDPRLVDCLRITIGTEHENLRMLSALANVMGS